MGSLAWYQKPVALLGAAAIAYHEVMRGRRTGVCQDCGRLNHASADTCLCGGTVAANSPPGEHLDDPSVAEYDVFARRRYRILGFLAKVATFVGILVSVSYAARPGRYDVLAIGFALTVLFVKLAD